MTLFYTEDTLEKKDKERRSKKMVVFLTSSPTGDLDGKYKVEGLDTRNDFLNQVRKYWKDNCRCLIATASPDDKESNLEFAHFWEDALRKSHLSVECVDLLDREAGHMTAETICSYDLIVMGGGHVPTQNSFFREIKLREKMKNFDGMIIGISAGTMNLADEVYAQPEEEGEAIDSNYQRFIKGLGYTDINVLPHYQMLKDDYLDGMRLFEDITFPDSKGKNFIALPDGSYIIVRESEAEIHGQAWKIYPDHMEEIL